jgi:hypothetical protein
MNYFDSDMSKSTNTVVYFDWKKVIYIYDWVQTKVGHYREGKEFTRTETVLGTGNTAGDIIVVKDKKTEKESAHKTVSSQTKLTLNKNSNMTSFFRFVKMRAIYRMGITPSL